MPCPFTSPKMFWAGPNFLCRVKNLFKYVCILAITNILCNTKRWFAFSKIGFYASTKVFEEALNSVKILDRQSACKITNSNKTCNFNVVFFKKKTYQKLLQNAYIWRSDTTIEGYTRTLLHMPYVWWSHITISLNLLEYIILVSDWHFVAVLLTKVWKCL